MVNYNQINVKCLAKQKKSLLSAAVMVTTTGYTQNVKKHILTNNKSYKIA